MAATSASVVRLQKSTTGRIKTVGLRILDAVAPRVAQRAAFDAFCTPVRRSQRPDVPGHPAHRFAFVEEGPEVAIWDWGDGRTVLLVHGWSGNAAQMTGFVEPLRRAGYYVAAPDLPAHGASGGRRTNLKELTETILQIGRRVGPVHAIVAHSFGAAAAVTAIARGLHVERAVLLAPPCDLAGYARSFGRFAGLSAGSADRMVEKVDGVIGGLENYDTIRAAAAQTARLLVLHDPADREVPFAAGRAIASAWPGGQLEAVKGAGHTRMLANRAVIDRTVSFIRGDEAVTARTA